MEQAVPVAILLHHSGRQVNRHVVRHAALHQHLHAVRGACHDGQFVHCATAPHFSVLQLALERVEFPRIRIAHSDAVDVTIDQDLQGTVSDSGDDVSESIDEYFIKPERFVLLLNSLAALAFVQALGPNRDHLPKESDDLGLIFSGGLEGRTSIRCHIRFNSLYLD